MKANIHPEYNEVTVICDCGNTFKTKSTKKDGIHTEICNECHPFYTGGQGEKKAKGRIDSFNKRYGMEDEKAAKETVKETKENE